MKKSFAKIMKCFIIVVLTAVLAFGNTVSVISVSAAVDRQDYEYLSTIGMTTTTYYVKEIKVGTYEGLKAEGYLVDKESATNRYYDSDGNICYQCDYSFLNGYGVCIGYKLTTDINEAIYDVAVMDMYGEYTELTYREALAEQQKNMTAVAERIMAAAEKLAEQYHDGSAYAKLAVETLNNMTISVERTVGGQSQTFVYPLGDYFVGNVNEDPELQDFLDLVFLCSPSTTGLIYNQLSQGIFDDLSQSGSTSWLTRLCQAGPLTLYANDGTVETDDGVLNSWYVEEGLDILYLDAAKEIYRTVKTFIDGYVEAKARYDTSAKVINENIVESAQKVNEGQLGDREGNLETFSDEEQAKADVVNDAMYLVLFEAMNAKRTTYYGPDSEALADYLEQNDCETVQEYLDATYALVGLPANQGGITKADYDKEAAYIGKLQNGCTETNLLYPYGTKADGSARSIAEFFLDVCTTDPESYVYANDLYRSFYPFLMENEDGIAPLNEEQETMFYVCGFNNALMLAVDVLDLAAIRSSVKDEMDALKTELGLTSISIYYDADTTLLKSFNEGSGIYWTSTAARITAAEKRYDLLTRAALVPEETAIDRVQKAIDWMSLLSTVVGGVGGIISTLMSGFGFLAAGVSCQAVTAAFFAGQAAMLSAGTIAFSVISTIMGWVSMVALVVILIMSLVLKLIDLFKEVDYNLEYTEIPECIYDYNDNVVLQGAAVKYYPVEVCDIGTPDEKTNIFSYYRNVRICPWVCLYYTKDDAAASQPITVDFVNGEQVTIPFVSYVSGKVFDDNDIAIDEEAGVQSTNLDGDVIRVYKSHPNKTYDVWITQYSGSAIEGIEGCEPNSPVDGGDGYAPIHGFDEVTAYNFAYYETNEWPTSLHERIRLLGDMLSVMKWYMHRPADYGADEEDNIYLKDVILSSDANEEVAKNKLIAKHHTVIDVNLTPNSNVYTYIGYTTTSIRSNAIVDLRWAYASGVEAVKGSSVSFGGEQYAACGSVGELTLFQTANNSSGTSTAGTPILINGPSSAEYPNGEKGKGLLVTTELMEGNGYEPVNLFCGGPAFDIDNCGDWKVDWDSSGNVSSRPNEPSSTWDSHVYLYFYPETTFVEGPDYLGGLAVFSGRDYGDDHQVLTYMQDMGWTQLTDVDISGHTYIMNINKTYLAYSTTHNPYRAIYGITQYTADSTAGGMKYSISAGSAGGYCVCEVFQQGGEGGVKYWERSMRMTHAYRTDSYWDGALVGGYIKSLIEDGEVKTYNLDKGGVRGSQAMGYIREIYTLADGYSLAYRSVSMAGVYVTGNTSQDISQAQPILVSELVVSTSPEYDSSEMTPVRSIVDWYADEPVNFGYTEAYSADVYYLFRDTYLDVDDVMEEDWITHPDGTNLEDNYDDGWYNINEDWVDDGKFNLYKDEHLYLFIRRPAAARPVFVASVRVAYAADNGYTGSNQNLVLQDLMNRAPVDETIFELVDNGPGQLIRVNLTGSGCDDDTDYYASCVDVWTHCTHGWTANRNRNQYNVPYDTDVGDRNDDNDYCESWYLFYNIPFLKTWRSDEVAYVWITFTNKSTEALSDLRIYECDAATYRNTKMSNELKVETGAKANKCGDSFLWNGKYYTLYSIHGLQTQVTDVTIDQNVFVNDEWTACSTAGKASSYTANFIHLKQYRKPLAKYYVAISSIVKSYASNERDAQIGLLNKGCRVIYPVNLKAKDGGALYVGYKLDSNKNNALSNLLLVNNGQDDTVTKLRIGSEEYVRLTDNLNMQDYDVILDFYGTSSVTRAASTGSVAGRYLTSLIFWSDPDFWQLFTGTDKEAEAKVSAYLAQLTEKDRTYLEYYLYSYVAGEKKLLKYSPVTDVYGNIVNCNLSSVNFASEAATDRDVFIFACYSDNVVVAPKSLVGSIFAGSGSYWVIGSVTVLLALTAVTAAAVKNRRKKKTAADADVGI